MRHKLENRMEEARIREGFQASRTGEPYGAFVVCGPCGRGLVIIADDGNGPGPLGGWEHVSVSIAGKHPPNWQEMCWVKNHFWTDEETVLQFHPRKSEYVNIHPNCLHLWRNAGLDHPLPPMELI